MAKLTTEAKVGLLVLAGSIILLYMTFVVGKYQFGGPKGYELSAVFQSVSGLNEKAAVRMAGVKIGTVERVELVDGRAKVIMQINPGVKIERGSEAAVETMGLLGEKFVEIIPPSRAAGGGTPDRPLRPASFETTPGGHSALAADEENAADRQKYLQPGETIRVTVSPSDVDKLLRQLSGIADDVKQVTGSLRQVLGTEQGTRSMQDILADLRATTANIRDFSTTLSSDGSELVMRMNELVTSLNGVVGENRENVKVAIENVREASKNAELALASIQSAARKIDRGEGTLGKLVSDDSMYNNIDKAAKGVGDYVTRVDRLHTIVGFRSDYLFPRFQNYASLTLKPSPDQYYIVEATSDPYGKFTQMQTYINPPGSYYTVDTYEYKFKFSIEYAKRWGNLALRAGVIESTGGIGADYYALNDRVKFSLDAWNFSATNDQEPGNRNAHVRATAFYNLNDVVFLQAGYDNFLNRDRAAPFIGLGVQFDDENLKYLLGSAPIPK